jgi:hypothetical protein
LFGPYGCIIANKKVYTSENKIVQFISERKTVNNNKKKIK